MSGPLNPAPRAATAAEAIITDRVTAIRKAGQSLEALEQIRDSTLAGTTLWNDANMAVHGVLRVIADLYIDEARVRLVEP